MLTLSSNAFFDGVVLNADRGREEKSFEEHGNKIINLFNHFFEVPEFQIPPLNLQSNEDFAVQAFKMAQRLELLESFMDNHVYYLRVGYNRYLIKFDYYKHASWDCKLYVRYYFNKEGFEIKQPTNDNLLKMMRVNGIGLKMLLPTRDTGLAMHQSLESYCKENDISIDRYEVEDDHQYHLL